ncbi:MAG: dihydropteroate synthase, partial [Candidatus Competibacteraceae bacterium]|nr:dihydropteroate synthase [Candidatus Competibacteraceae bacterium]MCB1813139.1 dihydropteroate synthase [Candidatus Competibacteraceae bacterium]
RNWIADIQTQMGRSNESRWAPRPMDIDILLWGETCLDNPVLTIPHAGMQQRGFVLTPLLALEPRLQVPGLGDKTILDWSRELAHHIPLWMGILNLTPDSFSDGGQFTAWTQIEPHVDAMVAAGAHIIDIGAESTRPGATPISDEQEWSRLAPVLERLLAKYQPQLLRPLLSVDTYHPEVARKALELGVDIINDVSGLSSPAMRELACSSDKDWIAMHYVSIPARKDKTLPPDCDPVDVVEAWLLQQLESWDKAGLNLSRIIFDPGIGFGKDGLQSLKLLQQAARFRRHGVRVLMGHSRKSFMKNFSALDVTDKDLTTLGASLNLCAQGVDIIRVHNIPMHTSAYRGWAHLVAP